jgi:hypothetical protein
MLKPFAIILVCAATVSAFCQTAPSNKYQPGTITAVTAHQIGPGEQASDVVRYDVSIKVADTVYVVLYTPPNGANMVEYSPGLDFLVLVGSDTLTFNRSGSGTTTEVPILRREGRAAESGIDPSKAPSQYFSLKLQHLSEALHLRDDQQAKIKPILEQEAGQLSQLWNNPVVSRKDKLNSLEKIVRSSDKKIKPLLSQDQVQKLEELRKEQKIQLKQRIAEETASK